MKQYNIILVTLLVGIVSLFASCSKIDDIKPESGTVLAEQLNKTNEILPSRADGFYYGMYTKLMEPAYNYSLLGSAREDDGGFFAVFHSNDIEAADIVISNSGYSWFSPAGDLASRNANYFNSIIRYATVYTQIGLANDLIKSFGELNEETSDDVRHKVAEAYAMRAFCYLVIAPLFQFNYDIAKDKPCVPLVTETTEDFANNPRATVGEVYDQIIADLNLAIENLEGHERADKTTIDQQVAYGLRARAYLNMYEYAKAAEDAAKAAEGYTPSSIEEASKPAFYDVKEHNWIWGYAMDTEVAKRHRYACSSSWIRSFSEYSYSAGVQEFPRINVLLYDKISSTDVRKGWWVNEDIYSPLLDGLVWRDLKGQEIATGKIEVEGEVVKDVFLPYAPVKFGVKEMGTDQNAEDWPFMRVEEMILIQAEGLVKSGKVAEGTQLLENFVKTYRDPEYSAAASGRNISDEIWFQRRVELWGEGFSNNDTRRLHKPLVRFHSGKPTNWPDEFAFNMTADDGWWLMRFCNLEKNSNLAIVDNEEGSIPKQGQNGDLRDGVTD